MPDQERQPEDLRIPLHVEEVSVSRREIKTADIQIALVTETRQQLIGEELTRVRVEVERVPIGRTIEVAPPISHEGDITIIPVVEEIVVVERRLVLKEELRIRRVSTKERHQETVVLREQEALITRKEADRAESTGRRNTTGRNVAMAGRRRSDRALRDKLRSPGRPGMARREDRLRFWALIAAGLSSEDAAIGAGVSPPVGTRWFREAGGMPSSTFAPSSRPLSGRYLAFAEREEIALALAQDFGVREIARRVGRAASTVSRELRRNAATRSGGLEYRAGTAQWHAERSARRPKRAKLTINAALRAYVQDRLAGQVVAQDGAAVRGPIVPWKGRRHGPRQKRRWGMAWSPEQIAQRLRHDFPGDETMQISHEAIYQALYVQGRGGLRRELTACLRIKRLSTSPERKRGVLRQHPLACARGW